MRYSELIRILKEHNCSFVKSGARHDIWVNAAGITEAIPRHNGKEVPTGMANKLLKWAGEK